MKIMMTLEMMNSEHYEMMKPTSQYSGVTLNAGGAISPSTGVFTCPVPGTSLFIGEYKQTILKEIYNHPMSRENNLKRKIY